MCLDPIKGKTAKLWFPANETFREKMRKFSVTFRKLFREISHFFAKINEAKTKRNAKCGNIFAKCKNFVKTVTFIDATINCSIELALIAQYLKFYYVI